jgi:hypothetical protein
MNPGREPIPYNGKVCLKQDNSTRDRGKTRDPDTFKGPMETLGSILVILIGCLVESTLLTCGLVDRRLTARVGLDNLVSCTTITHDIGSNRGVKRSLAEKYDKNKLQRHECAAPIMPETKDSYLPARTNNKIHGGLLQGLDPGH